MLALTRKTEYALIAVCHLVRHSDQTVSARDLASRYRMPLPLTMNVLKALNQRGVVTSVRGTRGGYRLARPPTDVNLADVIEAVEGPLRLVRCAEAGSSADHGCELEPGCTIQRAVRRVHERLRGFLATVTLAELAVEPAMQALNQGEYYQLGIVNHAIGVSGQ